MKSMETASVPTAPFQINLENASVLPVPFSLILNVYARKTGSKPKKDVFASQDSPKSKETASATSAKYHQ